MLIWISRGLNNLSWTLGFYGNYGILGIDAFLKFAEKRSEMPQPQRELQAKRDELRFKWMVDVEHETDLAKQLNSAKVLLETGPKSCNDTLN